MTNIMKRGDLPHEKAFEPNEEAHQPMLNTNMPSTGKKSSRKLQFSKDVDSAEITSSCTSSSYKDILSQPAANLSHVQKLLWLQKRRTMGLWVLCDKCDRWRYLPDYIDRHELPTKWYCSMNKDPEYANCSIPEAPLRVRDEEDLIHSEYTAGSLVWARLTGWPWWPAMVDDCPDAEQFYWLDGFSDIPTHYNVVFFDEMEATRAWISPENLKPYVPNKEGFMYLLKNKKFNSRLKTAISQADDADKMELPKRLETYSFLNRYKGNINSPRKVTERDLQKYQRRFKNKFNIEFPIESSDSEDDIDIDRARVNTDVNRKSGKRAKLNKDETVAESLLSTDVGQTDKPPNSMVAQVGSTEAASIDNDTSTTYAPANVSELSENPNATVQTDSPKSDDFDF